MAKAVKLKNLSIRWKTKLPYQYFQLVFRELQNYSCPVGLLDFSPKLNKNNKFFP